MSVYVHLLGIPLLQDRFHLRIRRLGVPVSVIWSPPNPMPSSGPIRHRGVDMNQSKKKITVYYDGACPSCIKDRENYEKLAGKGGEDVCWFDIAGQNAHLRDIGIDPYKALSELHVCDEHQQIVSELDAYILLMSRVSLLKPLAWLIGLPVIRPLLSSLYHRMVNRRLKKSGRLKR